MLTFNVSFPLLSFLPPSPELEPKPQALRTSVKMSIKLINDKRFFKEKPPQFLVFLVPYS
ncbi:hypothetical protein CHCC14688_2213 [Bacillus licheniformis]|nr:hypothetical protein CHCC15320_3944 [Bacillus licheniformis]TWM74879.1 hypothetical protein CHCC14688_2213 [Bacillus licheniformis]